MGVASRECPDLTVVGSMQERKAPITELSDGFIPLPGGQGTIEECFEGLTGMQLGVHRKACGLLKVCPCYRGMASFLEDAMSQQCIEPEHRSMVLIDESPEALIGLLRGF